MHYTVELRGDISAESDGTYLTRYSFDGERNVRVFFDGVTTTTNGYDDDGRLSTVSHADGFTESYLYDEDGDQKRMVDRSGITLWTYTPAGRLNTMSSPAGNVTYGYDAYGNQRTVAHAAPGVTPTIQTTITTNRVFPSGRVSWYGNGYTNVISNYTYDSSGRIDSSVICGLEFHRRRCYGKVCTQWAAKTPHRPEANASAGRSGSVCGCFFGSAEATTEPSIGTAYSLGRMPGP
ncbi:MAG: hypothetical protein EOP83_30110 [Verrucomicrobiaceae bacterium]|nr:MAG: hypothetical protein EOP83_30110 [Verrucomicrobiaceae bacterium]